ncbi:hypothetical protein FZC76_14040 [Sutcliffiella horikoshii]|uniref:TIR domain-containing protein n=1 Tax=Sutcliffiella horikoshii TaxID=79883 RepID=A0A5D4T0R0_9BACI|nr:hypothetical protein [Sutcliffiella horikoshii]TYS67686.1 hypothetical protein FZC76_14040 [Sutcliffiella horikoshii]
MMNQLEVSMIENNLSNHINRFLQDLLMIISNINDGNHNDTENKLKSLNFENNFRWTNSENSPNLLETIESIIKINSISSEEFRTIIIEEYGEKILESVKSELGLSKNDQMFTIDQIKLTYQSRLILILLYNQKDIYKPAKYDVFLSHSSVDSREVLGIKLCLLYEFDKVSYVDWIDDYELNSQRSTEKVINLLSSLLPEEDKKRLDILEGIFENSLNISMTDKQITNKILYALDNSNSYIYLDSRNSRLSKWMPYELGYAEAKLNKNMYRIIIKYKRTRKGILKYSSFLSKYETVNDLRKIK